MKVLLLGEFSGFHLNLKKALLSIGVDCKLASDGDLWKKIGGYDIELYPRKKNKFLDKMSKILYPLFIGKKNLRGFDVVQLVDPKIFHPLINKKMFKYIKKHNDKVFVSVAGHTYSLYDAYKQGKFDYYIFDESYTIAVLLCAS